MPMIPVLLLALERHGELELADASRTSLLAVSSATIERLLSEARVVAANGWRLGWVAESR